MTTMKATAANLSWLLTKDLFEPEESLDDAARIASAIAQLMDPEWREFVNEEQRTKHRTVSSGRGRA